MIKTIIILFSALIMGCALSADAQVRVVNETESEIFRTGKNTRYQVGTSKLKDGKIKLYYTSDKEDDITLAEIILKNEDDFNELFNIITDVFEKKPDLPVKVDLGDSYLQIYHINMLVGPSIIKLNHAYKSAPYNSVISKNMSYKEIKKLFDKP